MNNIKFTYLYRDAGNYKVWGPQSLDLAIIESKIRESLIDGEFFDPKYWKVNRLKHDDWIPELDHTWNEFDSIEMTSEETTVDYSITKFLDQIALAPNY